MKQIKLIFVTIIFFFLIKNCVSLIDSYSLSQAIAYYVRSISLFQLFLNYSTKFFKNGCNDFPPTLIPSSSFYFTNSNTTFIYLLFLFFLFLFFFLFPLKDDLKNFQSSFYKPHQKSFT